MRVKKIVLVMILLCMLCGIAEAEVGKGKEQPCVHIMTQEGQPVVSKEEYVPSLIQVLNCDEAYALTADGGVKIRGNSTADQGDEKPYRIKFTKKQNMLGLHHGEKYKSWVLLRTYWNLAPDYMAFHLADAIFGGKYYHSDSTYVNLYINGEYKGIYLLCEQNQAAPGRIDVREPKKGEEQPRTGYLLEMDNYAGDEHPYVLIGQMSATEDIAGERRAFPMRNYSIKSDIRSKEQFNFIRRHLNAVFRILYEAAVNDRPFMIDAKESAVPADGNYETAFEALDAVMDLESLANMLILEELVQNYDVGAGSFYMAVDFTEGSLYPKLTFLAPWDFNWAYYEPADGGYYACTFQAPQAGQDRSNAWFILAMKIGGFQDIVKAKWRKLSQSGVLADAARQVVTDCEKLAGDLDETELWRIDMVRNLETYVLDRIEWLNGQWLNE